MLFSGSLNFTEALELEIIQFLPHKGAISCTSKEGRRLVDKVGGDHCCPCQQFHHPEDATLVYDSIYHSISFENTIDLRNRLFLDDDGDDIDDSDSHDMMGLNAWDFTRKMEGNKYENMIWTCCGSSFYSSGCKGNSEVSPDEASIAIDANDKERTDRMEEETMRSFDGEFDRDWDNSWGGDAKPSCTCGYADGVYSYCAC